MYSVWKVALLVLACSFINPLRTPLLTLKVHWCVLKPPIKNFGFDTAVIVVELSLKKFNFYREYIVILDSIVL